MFCAFHRDCGASSSIVFGCDKDIRESIAAPIENSENASYHPMLIVGIVAEIERERHLKLVDDQVNNLLNRVYALSNEEEISENSELRAEHYPIKPWVRVSRLRKGLVAWKQQLQKMIDHIEKLEKNISERDIEEDESEEFMKETEKTDECEEYQSFSNNKSTKARPLSQRWREYTIRAGRRIRTRLLEIVDDYDEKIQECNIVIDGVSLAAQMVGPTLLKLGIQVASKVVHF